ncbi:hypothetical protein PROFUN_02720 [Planoprotostelium fungivorum]|uniref:Uncharacterized protein n=1 Tax=Planoprotostelium fungivorum TaxID=1890364 RepID=A0A2P6NVJ5_9EUKA|nr:hypothetical protein PROFUN_02720 [Planoprotostelium fungivorum]
MHTVQNLRRTGLTSVSNYQTLACGEQVHLISGKEVKNILSSRSEPLSLKVKAFTRSRVSLIFDVGYETHEGSKGRETIVTRPFHFARSKQT